MATAKKNTYGRYTKENEREKHVLQKKKSINTKENSKRSEEGPKTLSYRQKTIYNKGSISLYSLITTLSMNGLNSPIKRHGMADLMKKMRFRYILTTGDLL